MLKIIFGNLRNSIIANEKSCPILDSFFLFHKLKSCFRKTEGALRKTEGALRKTEGALRKTAKFAKMIMLTFALTIYLFKLLKIKNMKNTFFAIIAAFAFFLNNAQAATIILIDRATGTTTVITTPFGCEQSRQLIVQVAESRGIDLRDYSYYCTSLQGIGTDIASTVVANGISIKPTKLDSKDGGKTLTAESQKELAAIFVKTEINTKLPKNSYMQYFDKAGNLTIVRLSADSDLKALNASAEKLTAAGKPSFAIATAYNKATEAIIVNNANVPVKTRKGQVGPKGEVLIDGNILVIE